MAGGAQQQQQQDDSMSIVWVFVLGVLVLGLIWYFGHDYIVGFVVKVKYYESKLLSFFSSTYQKESYLLSAVNPSNLTLEDVYNVCANSKVSNFYRYPVSFILLVMAFFLYTHNIKQKFSHKYNMLDLAAAEKINWPQITPVIGLDLVSQDLMKGSWSMALNPLEFCKQHHLLNIEYVGGDAQHFHKSVPKISLKQELARRVFVNQLGIYWTSIYELPLYMQALFASFIARANRDRDNSDKILKQLAASCNEKDMNYAGVQEILAKFLKTKIVERVINRHAYVFTVFPSILKAAREDGVLASADFLWLKPKNRTLWYVLNCVGRQTPYVEVGGVFAHWLSENKYGKSIKVPMIDEAIKALELALTEIKYIPDEDKG